MQVILRYAGFMNGAESLYEALVSSSPGIKFDLAFAEANGLRLILSEGNCDTPKLLSGSNIISLGIADSISPSGAETKANIEKRCKLLRGSSYKK